jgi:hypothetical protein
LFLSWICWNTGRWMLLVIGCYWSLDVTGRWLLLVTGCYWSLDVTGHWKLLVAGCYWSLDVKQSINQSTDQSTFNNNFFFTSSSCTFVRLGTLTVQSKSIYTIFVLCLVYPMLGHVSGWSILVCPFGFLHLLSTEDYIPWLFFLHNLYTYFYQTYHIKCNLKKTIYLGYFFFTTSALTLVRLGISNSIIFIINCWCSFTRISSPSCPWK